MLDTYMESRIPSRGNIVREGRTRSNFASQTEVAHLEHVIIEQEILRLHVAMEEALFMNV